MNKSVNPARGREYMTAFFRRRSIIALGCCVLTLALAFYGVIAGIDRTYIKVGPHAFLSFIFYTNISNTLAALSAAFVIPFAVDGVRKMRFTLPRWVAVAHYVAAVSIAIVMLFTLAFISWASPDDAFGGTNLYLHVFCPVLILVSFFQIENDHIYTFRDRLAGCVPFLIYAMAYLVEVILIGEENGGWPDIYRIREFLSPWLAFPAMLLFGFCVSWLVAALSNFLTRKRRAAMFRQWTADTDPVEVRVEAYGLGRMAGLVGEKNRVQIPFDILEHLAEKYRIPADRLTRPFMTGLLNGMKERNDPSPGRARPEQTSEKQ